MANPTTNYGFVLPTPTDLVTDLPADFDVALQGVDTRLKALQPGTTAGDLAYSSATANTNVRLGIGTTGQVLAVSGGGVPAWTTTADVTPLTTKGDIFTFSTEDARLAVGATNGMVLTVDSTTPTGLKYATPAAGGKVLQVVSVNFSTATTVASATLTDSGLTATITPTLATSKIFIIVTQPLRALRDTTGAQQIEWQLFRGATAISGNTEKLQYQMAADGSGRTNITVPIACNLLDSPATTSATTYKTQVASAYTSSNGQVIAQGNGTMSTITLIEIGA